MSCSPDERAIRGEWDRWSACWCEDCGEDLAPEGTTLYDGALIGCIECHHVHRVNADSEGISVEALACQAEKNGECFAYNYCPQLRDGEPVKSGRDCPYAEEP